MHLCYSEKEEYVIGKHSKKPSFLCPKTVTPQPPCPPSLGTVRTPNVNHSPKIGLFHVKNAATHPPLLEQCSYFNLKMDLKSIGAKYQCIQQLVKIIRCCQKLPFLWLSFVLC